MVNVPICQLVNETIGAIAPRMNNHWHIIPKTKAQRKPATIDTLPPKMNVHWHILKLADS